MLRKAVPTGRINKDQEIIMSVKVLRILIWVGIIIAGFRGLWAFDGGPSADSQVTVAAGVMFSAALLSATIMYCFGLTHHTDEHGTRQDRPLP